MAKLLTLVLTMGALAMVPPSGEDAVKTSNLTASTVVETCMKSGPSCAPKDTWHCWHIGMPETLSDHCDPADPGCL
jgi:hypothetical protein